MRKFTLRMEESQIGIGDREVVGRLMSRLMMAKVLDLMGHNVDNFTFQKESYSYDSYYPLEAKIEDILDFLDLVNAEYIWEEEEYELTLKFKRGISDLTLLIEAIHYGWSEMDYEELDEGEEIHESIENGLLFRLKSYEGIPLMFFKNYYELLKENELI